MVFLSGIQFVGEKVKGIFTGGGGTTNDALVSLFSSITLDGDQVRMLR
jgi:hypothetical protein